MSDSDRQPTIDLNADFGEASTPEQLAIEDAVIKHVTSVNIACGGHAGDEASMRRAVQAAKRHGVAIGAHPSFPDRANFGRAHINLDPASLHETIAEQITALHTIALSEGVSLSHCKPHGALYHAASAKESVAMAIYQACTALDPDLRLIGQAGSQAVAWWRGLGAEAAEEAFADRVYESTGQLRSRTLPNALITHPQTAAEQACQIATTQTVRCADGATLPLKADTLCIHADTPHAADIVEEVARSLKAAGVKLHLLD